VRLRQFVAGGQRKRGNFFQGGMSRAADPVRIRVGTKGHILNQPVKGFQISVRKVVGHFFKIMPQNVLSCYSTFHPLPGLQPALACDEEYPNRVLVDAGGF